ncbi:MAG: 5'-nucleotidase C-terminal domain-containing protein [Myxococcales bacterium]|nr:5'-nucleotidase C-terminal domain-containing protein [Myxococcales bacterium]
MHTKLPLTPRLALLLAGLVLSACGDSAGDTETASTTATTGASTSDASSDATSDDATTAGTSDATTDPSTTDTDGDATHLRLTVLHNNDGESQLLNAGAGLEDFGGVARFTTLVKQLRAEVEAAPDTPSLRHGAITLSSGDNFLAGPEFAVSLEQGAPYLDAVALSEVGYDAICVGNHDVDFGPDVLAAFISSFAPMTTFLSANLDVSQEPLLDALAGDGLLVASVVVDVGGDSVGVIGATTPMLPFISSPRDIVVDPDVAGRVQAEVDALTGAGINKIILISHLQSIEEDLELAPQLSGVDIMIAGGGDELLANDGAVLIPGDEEELYGPYPLMSGAVPIVTTKGGYRYVGRLIVEFDEGGELVAIDEASGVVRVAGGALPDAVEPDPVVQEEVVAPIAAALAALDANVIASSEVTLDGTKTSVRTMETNEGDLIADALLWSAGQRAADFGAPLPTVALQNGGGIRNDSALPAGELTELDTFDMLPFANFVTIVPGVPPGQFKEILENAVSAVEQVDGRFAQIAGFTLIYDPDGQPQVIDEAGVITQEGTRVLEVVLDDDTVIVSGGVVDPGAPSLDVATINFLASGGDQYPFGDLEFTSLGVTYQAALRGYIEEALAGTISAADYPEGGEGRVSVP